ncbi:hypothetical protein [Bacillus smithii]|uniref:hypothetical protein n=1 Tax=Bacillus smithii TaxID=1479 RepID=UPI0030C95C65
MLKDRYLLFWNRLFLFPACLGCNYATALLFLMMTLGLSPCLFEQQTYIDQSWE